MIKLIALLTMLVDHIGITIFPQALGFRVIGRVSMPLFAYCIARGFYYSKQHDTVHKYILNMLIFALVSQLPYCLMVGEGLNIGFTWLISLLLLSIFTTENLKNNKAIGMASIALLIVTTGATNLLPVDYGVYGVITPLLFYCLMARDKESTMNYVLILLIGWAIYALINKGSAGSMVQLISVASAAILAVSKKRDEKIKLPKWLCYSFYPAHMALLMLIRYVF